ncbi:fringe glycosyltransferase isoform X1 [Frankliniella occidentalis]|uniref:Fringe glycosyltransferase isoform X1 n=1 Tax=Frankliniella occidentalis TaxID=133901 RepID=A0A6J1RVX1_FRAOC|nr:fringe glycosyltransferase isoform X1 [Frankliniella occidentalis]
MPCRRGASPCEDLDPVIRGSNSRQFSGRAASGGGGAGGAAMAVLRVKRALQALLLVSALAYMSLLLYQSVTATGYAQQGPGRPASSGAGLVAPPPPPAGLSLRQPQQASNGDLEAAAAVPVAADSNSLDPDPVTVPPLPPMQPPGGAAGGAGGAGGMVPVSGPGVMTAATATSKPPTTTLQDIFVSVKTTRSYHRWRLPVIIKTWFQLAKDQTWFFTDTDDPDFQKKTNGHMVNTNCSSSHNRRALCCKLSVELDTFLDSDKKWFCHFDDDNYVNIPRLVRVLGDYSPQQDWYLGKPSTKAPLEIISRENKSQKISFWFATGGAGFCLSRALALKMLPVAGGGKFISIGEKIRLPDDVTMGYVIEHLLRKPLTVIDQFHSHFEPMKFIRQETMHEQITFSYSRYSKHEVNVLKIDGFDSRLDPTRFLSLHCLLFSYLSFCPR